MSKMSFSKDRGRFSRFLSSKGFYVALAVCLVGAGTATYMAVNQTISSIEDSNNQVLEQGIGGFPQLEETEQWREDIPKDTTMVEQYSVPESSSSTASSSSEASAGGSEQSDTQASSTVSPTLTYALPVKGAVTAQYSNGELIKNVTLNDWRTHDGVDISANRGDDVYAAADGAVTDISNDPLWGTTVTVLHADGNETVYSGLDSKLPVEVGENVLVRQVIGKVEGVPCEVEDGVHIHFAMRSGGKWVDPLSMIAQSE